MSNKNLLVALFVIGMTVWVFSGELTNNTVTADETTAAGDIAPEVARVRGIKSTADRQTVYLDVRGQTRAHRTVHVKSEISGKVVALPGEKGSRVKSGDLLCRVVVETPVKLNRQQKEMLREFDETMGDDEHRQSPKSSSWLDSVKEFFEGMTH